MNPGQHITHYDVAEKLGEGGMGVVYKAWDTKLSRFVALKFLPAPLSGSPAQVTRLQQEARAISTLNHPNIATIYEIDEVEGRCFLALEYLPGGTLKSALEQIRAAGQQMSLEQGLDYALQIAEALAHAHSHNIIHRDVKTGNMLFTASGLLKITDFGLAKLSEGADLTQTGSVVGTPATMSPEQAQGIEADARSDIFSAGTVLFEIFTGELPFKGSTPVAMMHQVVYTPAPPLSQFRSGTPLALEQIVTKALVKERSERYQSAAELAADLKALRRELLLGSTTGRSALETVTIAATPARRRRSPALVVAACLVSGLVILGTGWIASPALRNAAATGLNWLRAKSLPAEKRLAILPFRNVGGDPKDQALVDGLREVVINKLTRLERPGGSLVVVVSPDEVQAKEVTSASDAAKRLGANLVMTGSVVQSGQQPQVIVNIEDPHTQAILRSETLDISHPDLSAQAEGLVRLLELGISNEQREALRAESSSNPAASRFYVEGRGYMRRADRSENLDLAVSAFSDAISKDSNYALAEAGLAEAYRWKYRAQKDPMLLDQSVQHALRSLQLNKRVADPHITMGQVLLEQGKSEDAAKELQVALSIEPANAGALQMLGYAYAALRRDQDAEATYKKAIEIRPGDPHGYTNLGVFYFNLEKLADAERSFRRAIDLAPDNYLAHSNLGAVYIKGGRYPEAITELQKSVDIAPSARGFSNLGAALYSQKRFGDAVQAYRQAVALQRNNSIYWGNLADAYRWTPDLRGEAPGAYQQAIELLLKDIKVNDRDPRLHARLAFYYASIADRGPALAQIGEALRQDSSLAYVQFQAALVYEQLGDRAKALAALEKALKSGQSPAPVMASPVLEKLRQDPGFDRIIGPRP